MTEIEQLQKQIQELQKTVDDLKSGTVKYVSLKDRLSKEQCEIFNKYFESKFDSEDEYWKRGDFQKSGIVIANERRDQSRKAIRDLAKNLYMINHFSEYSDFGSFVIEKLLKSEESIQEYLGIFEELCKEAATKINNDRFKVKG